MFLQECVTDQGFCRTVYVCMPASVFISLVVGYSVRYGVICY